MEKLKIISGGRLREIKWVYDEEKGKGSYVRQDVTDAAPKYLMRACSLANDVVLKDIFLLLERHLSVFETVIGLWVAEFVAEGLQGGPSDGNVHASGIDYLELYWQLEQNSGSGDSLDNVQPKFHGINKDAEIPYGVSQTPANDLASLPLKLNLELVVVDAKTNQSTPYEKAEFSLGQILYGIIWELSWYGPPEKRNRFAEELGRRDTKER